jgi:hypothetical protein
MDSPRKSVLSSQLMGNNVSRMCYKFIKSRDSTFDLTHRVSATYIFRHH